MFPERVIVDDSVTSGPDGLAARLRIPWYRALPVSCVDRLEVAIDGADVPQDHVRFVFDGTAYRLDELDPFFDTWWYVLDDAGLLIVDPPEHGAEVELTVTLGMRIPYLPVGPRFLVLSETCTKTMRITHSEEEVTR